MKSSIASGLLAASSLLYLVSADAPGTFSVKIAKNRHVEKAQLAKRGTVQVTLANYYQVGLYAANATVGTPGQALTFQVDTGSSDVWVPSSNAAICQDTNDGGCPFGSCKLSLHVRQSRGPMPTLTYSILQSLPPNPPPSSTWKRMVSTSHMLMAPAPLETTSKMFSA
jgi:hypothetical protein